MRTLLVSTLAAILVFPGASAPADSTRVEFEAVVPALIQQRLEMVTHKNRDRRATLERLFQEVGCEASLTAQAVPHSKEANVVCALPGDGDGAIVVGGHFDADDAGIGAVDDWSGAALLPSLYQSLKGKARRHRFVFVGFAAEEVGLRGSAEYVKKLSADDRLHTRAMINLECLGLTPPKVWSRRADARLLDAYIRVAGGLLKEVAGSNVEQIGDDDSHPFKNAGIPVLTIHSVTQETLHFLHSPGDNLKAINVEDYYSAYRLAATYLAYLDSVLE